MLSRGGGQKHARTRDVSQTHGRRPARASCGASDPYWAHALMNAPRKKFLSSDDYWGKPRGRAQRPPKPRPAPTPHGALRGSRLSLASRHTVLRCPILQEGAGAAAASAADWAPVPFSPLTRSQSYDHYFASADSTLAPSRTAVAVLPALAAGRAPPRRGKSDSSAWRTEYRVRFAE